MAKWKATLDIREDWQAAEREQISVQVLCERLIPKLEDIGRKLNDNLSDFITELQEIVDDPNAEFDDFDEVLEDLYDWADDNRVWVESGT